MSSTSTELRQVPPFAPPAGFRWLRRGETVKSTDYGVLSDRTPMKSDAFPWTSVWHGTLVGHRSADLGDLGDSIRFPFCRPAPVTPLGKVDPKTGRRPPILGLTFGAWFWYEQPPKPCFPGKFPAWYFFSLRSAAEPCGFAPWVTHFVEAGDDVNTPAPLRDDQRELRYLAAEKGSVKAALAAEVKSALLSVPSDPITFGDLQHYISHVLKATKPTPGAFVSAEIKYDISSVPCDPPKPAKLPAHKVPHCPAGWRKLVAGEKVLETDLYWSPDNVWTSRLGTKRVGKPWQLGCRATIRKEGPRAHPTPTVKIFTPAFANTRPTSPGDGYVLLKKGDRIEAGDEYWAHAATYPRWVPFVACVGDSIPGTHLCRRKIPAADSPLVPGDGYRLLYDFEVPTDDDEFLNLVTSDTPSDAIKKDRYGRRCWESSRGYYARNSKEGLLDGQDTAERRRGLGNLTPAQFAFRRKLLPTEQYLPGWRLLRPDEALKAGDRFRRSCYEVRQTISVIPDNVREYRTVGEFALHLSGGQGNECDNQAVFYRNTSTE